MSFSFHKQALCSILIDLVSDIINTEYKMGRWGFRKSSYKYGFRKASKALAVMFEGDYDSDVLGTIQDDLDLQLAGTDPGNLFDTFAEHPHALKEARNKLDAGSGTSLMQKARHNELSRSSPDGYDMFIVAAVIMHTGAKLGSEDRQILRVLFHTIPKLTGFVLPLMDHGFRKPGAAQFIAGLDSYVNGTPRSFTDSWSATFHRLQALLLMLSSSCYSCGKIENELDGETLKRCARCSAHYCSKDCQKADWKDHKLICKPTGAGGLLNV